MIICVNPGRSASVSGEFVTFARVGKLRRTAPTLEGTAGATAHFAVGRTATVVISHSSCVMPV
jgi:hypothetical protein